MIGSHHGHRNRFCGALATGMYQAINEQRTCRGQDHFDFECHDHATNY